MKKISFRTLAIATSTIALATMLSASLSIDSAQARRLYVSPYYHHPYNHYVAAPGLAWYAVRAYYWGGPWSGTSSGPWAYSGWDDYAQHNGIGCTPGTLVKGGDGIMYVCQ